MNSQKYEIIALGGREITIENIGEIPFPPEHHKTPISFRTHQVIVPKVSNVSHTDVEALKRMYCLNRTCSISSSDNTQPGATPSLAGKRLVSGATNS